MSILKSIYVHIVTWNSESVIEDCLNSLLSQEEYQVGVNLIIHVSDNLSHDKTCSIVESKFDYRVHLTKNDANNGFCMAHTLVPHTFFYPAFKYY